MRRILSILISLYLCSSSVLAVELRELLAESCLDCHAGDDAEAGLNLEPLTHSQELLPDYGVWKKVALRVAHREMPPADYGLLDVQAVQDFRQSFRQQIRDESLEAQLLPGPFPLRRLNRFEYNRTMRDLLGVYYDAGHRLPVDGAGGEGFDNAAETLLISPIHAEKYLLSVKDTLDYARRNQAARKKLFIARPTEEVLPRDAAKVILADFLTRAFRRPVDESEIQRAVNTWQIKFTEQDDFESAVFDTLPTILMSPHFLFRVQQPAAAEVSVTSRDIEFGTRLSYFLWATMPDKELFQSAVDGKLNSTEQRRAQVDRMLADNRVRGLAESFVGQWLGTRDLAQGHTPDSKMFPKFDDEVRDAMQEEPIEVFRHMLQKNLSLLDLIDGNYTFINRQLANLYELHGDERKGLREFSRRVELPEESVRGGLLTMSGVHRLTSFPHRTSPVLRGKWVLETLLGATLAPPPPDIPDLDAATGENEKHEGESLRKRLLRHRDDPNCISCHQRMDPIGFALESFDPVGRFRTKEADIKIDTTAELPGGVRLDGVASVRNLLMEHRDEFVRNIVTRMFGYAVGRGLVQEDYPAVERIMIHLEEDDYRIQTLIHGIVASPSFAGK